MPSRSPLRLVGALAFPLPSIVRTQVLSQATSHAAPIAYETSPEQDDGKTWWHYGVTLVDMVCSWVLTCFKMFLSLWYHYDMTMIWDHMIWDHMGDWGSSWDCWDCWDYRAGAVTCGWHGVELVALWRTQVTIPPSSHVSHPGAQHQMIRSGCQPLWATLLFYPFLGFGWCWFFHSLCRVPWTSMKVL